MHKLTKISSDEFSKTYDYRGVKIISANGEARKFSFTMGQVRGFGNPGCYDAIRFTRLSDAKDFIDSEFDK